ncbi:glycosyltransferase [Herbaspirillum huttiense]|uniref:glycosyltransferase n=1 Tax=Herbaspirillum huttiense TaxID=863372 RepID=UPI001065A376|nr:glycosyltransferase [Herbaspirillum huttiense]QBP75635.1 glycosyltransferase [Herbaspirillum huttiense]
MNDLVTIYVPTKNRLGLLTRAVNSVLAQTYRNLELIVVSDGATDGTCEYVRGLNSDIRIKLIHHPQSQGACAARNHAIEAASGRFVTGIDDDDVFMPDRIERFLQQWYALEEQGQSFSCLFDRRIVNAGRVVMLWDTDARVDLATILETNAIGNQVFTTSERLRQIGMFDTAMPAWQDWETWVRLVREFGPAISICSNTYLMDISHEMERITLKSPERIISAAQLFYDRHCQRSNMAGLLRSLAGYEQIKLSASDFFTMLGGGRSHAKFAVRQLKYGKYKASLAPTLHASPGKH